MEISFVRVRGQRDRIYVHRSDGSEVSWVFPTYHDRLPHDLVHLVVEAAYGVRRGFWGRVDTGIDPARINEEANRIGGAGKYAGFGEDQREILLAEALAAAPWLDPEVSDEARHEEVGAMYDRSGVARPEAARLDRAREVRRTLERLTGRWSAIGDKGTIVLRFEPDEPEQSFKRFAAD